MKNIKTKLLLTALTLGVLVSSSYSQERPLHEIHSMMVYNFIKYIQWPDSNSDEFIIGVLGEDDVYKTLTTWYNGKLKGSQKLTIRKYDQVADMKECHVLYISSQSSKYFDDVQQNINKASTLVITDKPGMGEKGSAINFKQVNNRLAFELNQAVIDASSLKVSRQLAGIAILI